jgi:hypothetical protein
LAAPLSLGELIDKLTITEIKGQRIVTPAKRAHVRRERDALAAVAAPYLSRTPALMGLKRRLLNINRTLWVLENASRARFGRAPQPPAKASALLTRIARINDLRHRIKQRISRLSGSAIVEQKSYY